MSARRRIVTSGDKYTNVVRPSKVNKQFQPLDKRKERCLVVHGGDNKTNEKRYGMVQKYVCTTEVELGLSHPTEAPGNPFQICHLFFTPLTVSVAYWNQCRAFQMTVMTVMLMF